MSTNTSTTQQTAEDPSTAGEAGAEVEEASEGEIETLITKLMITNDDATITP